MYSCKMNTANNSKLDKKNPDYLKIQPDPLFLPENFITGMKSTIILINNLFSRSYQ